MKEILVISDTHKNIDLLKEILSVNNDCDIIMHLGDNYEDMEQVIPLWKGKKLYRVPGIFHSGYKNHTIPAQIMVSIEKVSFLLVHSPQDFGKQQADIMLFGHTHAWEISAEGKGITVNPGHLQGVWSRGRVATYARISVTEGRAAISIYGLDHHKVAQTGVVASPRKNV